MQHDIIIQDNVYKTITTNGGCNVVNVMKDIGEAIAAGQIVIDETKPVSVKIVPHK